MKKILTLALSLISVAAAAQQTGGITPEMLVRISGAYAGDAHDKAIRNALNTTDINVLATNADKIAMPETSFSDRVVTKGITNQKKSGRCWLFTGLNVLRAAAIQKYDLGDFQFSQSYCFFYDQLEKANLFLQAVIDTREKPMSDREVDWLFSNPIGDGGTFTGVANLVTKYGLVPADVMPETLSRTNLGSLGKGACVNLERAMAADGRFGGHIVSGHIDGTGTVSRFEKDGNAVWVYIAAPGSILNLIIEKGSIAIDGISLTVAKVNAVEFAVSVIPHTGEETTLLGKKAGDMVNLENDVIGKYVQKLMGLGRADGSSSQAERDEKLLNWLK